MHKSNDNKEYSKYINNKKCTFDNLAFINLDELIDKYGFDNMPENKFEAQKLLEKIGEKIDCQIRIFLAKRAGLAELWISKIQLDTYVQYYKNKQFYSYLILDNRCQLADIISTILDWQWKK